MPLHFHFLEFSKLLNAREVRYLLIGGHAVAFHGWSRFTKDIDFWIASDLDNERRTVLALKDFGLANVDENVLAEWNAMVRFGVPPFRVEILKSISGVTFEEAWPNRTAWSEGGVEIPVISLADLRKNKAATGRLQDLADLENLPQK
jgi:hypothetical protein